MITTVRTWLRKWWLRVPEPRVFSVGWGVAYLMLGCAGVSALVAPPYAVSADASRLDIAVALGGLNLIGMAIAMVAGYKDFWQGERLGISLMLAAAAIYASLVLYQDVQTVDSLALQFFYLAFVVVILGIRLLMIRWFTYRPRG